MNVIFVDGKAIFAKWKIKTNIDLTKHPKLQRLDNIENKTDVVIYWEEHKNGLITYLNQEGIAYEIEDIIWDKETLDKTVGKEFKSKGEIIKYLIEDIEPERYKLPKLEKENTELKQRLLETEDVLLQIMFS